MYDVVLIHPPVSLAPRRGGRPRFGLPPLGILYLAAYLNRQGVKTTVIDASFEDLQPQAVVDRVRRYRPGLVGISGMTPHFQSVKRISAALGALKGGRFPIVLGGPHFSATGPESFEWIPEADFIIEGEAEFSLYRLFLGLERNDFSSVGGLNYRDNGGIRTQKRQPLPCDLDSLPFPNLSHLDVPCRYRVRYGRQEAVMSLMASRGCPFHCSFCDVSLTQGRKLRLRSPRNIVDEIRFHMDAFGIREFVFKDSTFTVDPSWVYALTDLLEAERLNITWSANTRVDMVDEDLLRRMQACGCRKVAFGVESGDETVLRNIRKGIRFDQVRKAFNSARKVRLEAHAFFMIGNPGESVRTVEKTVELAKELNPPWAAFAPTIVYPGTPMYAEAVRRGLLRNDRWYLEDETEVFLSNVGSVSKGQMDLPAFPPELQLRYVKRAYRKFYLRPAWVLQLAKGELNWTLLKSLIRSAVPFLSFLGK